MQYAVELYFDEETEKKLFGLAQRIADEKISTKFLEYKTRPHLTLACFNDAAGNGIARSDGRRIARSR